MIINATLNGQLVSIVDILIDQVSGFVDVVYVTSGGYLKIHRTNATTLATGSVITSDTVDVIDGANDGDVPTWDVANNRYEPNATLSAKLAAIGQNYLKNTNPTVNDDASAGYEVWDKWMDQVGGEVYICLDNTAGDAVWEQVTLDAADLASLFNAKIGGSTGSTDNALLRADGTEGKTLQSSGVVIDDNNDVTGVRNLAATGYVSTGIRRVEKAKTGALAILDIIGTILTNYGQTAENIQTLPDTADVVTALGTGVEVGFVVRVETEGAGAFGLKPGADDKHYFDGGGGVVALDNGAEVVFEVPNIGDTLVVTMIRTGESSFDWLTACVRGAAI
jgi:hypothetical protein